MRIKTSSTGKSELMTVEGFYELLKKDEDLSAIIATIVHDASREMCRLMTGKKTPKAKKVALHTSSLTGCSALVAEGKPFELKQG